MHKAMTVWEAWQKRLPGEESSRLLGGFDYAMREYVISVFYGGYTRAIFIELVDGRGLREVALIPLGRDGLVGGTEFLLALTLDNRRLAEVPALVSIYEKLLQCGEELGFLVFNEGAANWPADMPYGC